ncbi:MAG: hypothetical protein NTV51_25735 [Verrucomicrobia bacterium]|nr:hypothetical protein [Verrucomicrobiota bacterium]
MLPRSRNRNTARWPFWLLIVAWVCANSPQAATYALISWIGEARHFTHQQRLTAEVAHVLTGAKDPERTVEMTAAAKRPLAPPTPAEATLKKIELAVERTAEVLPPTVRGAVRAVRATTLPDERCEAPPHEPPRAWPVLV